MSEYRKLHEELIDHLKELGIHHNYEDRITLAWYRHNIKFVTNDTNNLGHVIGLMDKLVKLRIDGKELKHDGRGRYLEDEKASEEGTSSVQPVRDNVE